MGCSNLSLATLKQILSMINTMYPSAENLGYPSPVTFLVRHLVKARWRSTITKLVETDTFFLHLITIEQKRVIEDQ